MEFERDLDGSQQRLPTKPYVGMTFESEEEAYCHYNKYGRETGFGIRKGKVYYDTKTKCPITRYFYCKKQGYKEKNSKKSTNAQYSRPTNREGCLACLRIKVNSDGKWVVDLFKEDHTHGFVTPSRITKLRSHKRMSSATRSMIDSLHNSMGPSQIANTLSSLEGDGHVVVSQQAETRNYLKKFRKSNISHDCMNVIKTFMERHVEDDGFFFEAEIDEEYRMRSIFWADSRTRMTFQKFGDVVVFDTTYRTNTFSVPFASFTGVNHHKESILFGCALLADETEETFVWLFRTWLKAMGGKMPKSIITDQYCLAMGKAIERVFLGSIHRLCMWHIGQNELKHLSHIKSQYTDFEADYQRCKYSNTIPEFESRWSKLLQDYDLIENTWLAYMYDVREHWIPCYLNGIFFGGMTTTQHSESINAFFDGYVDAKTPLNEFVKAYDCAVLHRREAEKHEDHMTLYRRPVLWSNSPLELQARDLYTRTIFNMFQEELKNTMVCIAKKSGQENSIIEYVVGFYDSENKKFAVKYDETQRIASCSCQKFEFEGLLCKHILKVFLQENVLSIPSRYILSRWTIGARFGHVHSFTSNNEAQYVSPVMVWNMREATLKLIDLGIKSIEHYSIAMPALISLVDKLELVTNSNEENESVNDNASQNANLVPLTEQIKIRIRDPERAIMLGSPRNSQRIRSSLEENDNRNKQWTCGYCNQKGHYITICPQKKDDKSTSYD